MGRLTLDGTLAEDVLDGLTRPFKELPPKHFYDARGSELFEAICELPEYYPTRTERAILQARARAILRAAGTPEVLELGAGAATKARLLLATGLVTRYLPFDVSETALADTAGTLADEYPDVEIHPIAGDFERVEVNVGMFVSCKANEADLSGFLRLDERLVGAFFVEDTVRVLVPQNLMMLHQIDVVGLKPAKRFL